MVSYLCCPTCHYERNAEFSIDTVTIYKCPECTAKFCRECGPSSCPSCASPKRFGAGKLYIPVTGIENFFMDTVVIAEAAEGDVHI